MKNQPNVLFVVLDTVRRDRVSSYGYARETTPNFDAFADGAMLYADPVAQGSWSVPSHASLFTGKYPFEHGARTISPVLRGEATIAERLSGAGYHTVAVSPNEYVRPLLGFGRGFDEFHTPGHRSLPAPLANLAGRGVNYVSRTPTIRRPLEYLFNRFGGATSGESPRPDGSEVVDRVDAVLDDVTDPYFLFVNLTDAHLPRSPEPRFRDRFVDPGLSDVAVSPTERDHNFGGDVMDDRALRKLRQLYDADLRTADERLGDLLSVPRQHGALSDTLVAVVSDHGENLGEAGLIGHQHSVRDSVVSVPMAIQYPGQTRGRVVEEQVETRRLFHTILDATGVERYPEETLQSVGDSRPAFGEFYTPMLDVDRLSKDHTAVYDRDLLGRTLSFVRDGEYKLVRRPDRESLHTTPDGPESEVSVSRHQRSYEHLRGAVPAGAP